MLLPMTYTDPIIDLNIEMWLILMYLINLDALYCSYMHIHSYIFILTIHILHSKSTFKALFLQLLKQISIAKIKKLNRQCIHQTKALDVKNNLKLKK